jgi:electron transfer flavoprotein alpha subunit
MKALVFLEHDGTTSQPSALGLLGKAAAQAPGDVAAVVVGPGPLDALVAEAGRHGAATVHVAQHDALVWPLPHQLIDIVEDVVCSGGYDTVMFSTSVLATDVAAGLSARLDAGLNWDLVDIATEDGRLIGSRPALGDSVMVKVGWTSAVRIALFRAGSFEVEALSSGQPRVEHVDATRLGSQSVRVVDRTVRETTRSSMEDAEVIVAGGLGLGGPENFALVEQLAALLGGAVGATRAVVYKGWYPPSTQIGQTGKTVRPQLYVALGISGAVQHKVGMKNSKNVVAVNLDPSAPIFDVSDLAVIGDLHTIVAEVIELLKARKAT